MFNEQQHVCFLKHYGSKSSGSPVHLFDGLASNRAMAKGSSRHSRSIYSPLPPRFGRPQYGWQLLPRTSVRREMKSSLGESECGWNRRAAVMDGKSLPGARQRVDRSPTRLCSRSRPSRVSLAVLAGRLNDQQYWWVVLAIATPWHITAISVTATS